MVIKTTEGVYTILKHYEINSLLMTVPSDYILPANALKIYQSKLKKSNPIEAHTDDLNSSSKTFLKNLILRSNLPKNTPKSIVLSHLIEYVCDCSKIHTKNITRALNKYYDIAKINKNGLGAILEAYSNSLYYNKERGLNEETLAYFLISDDGQALLNKF